MAQLGSPQAVFGELDKMLGGLGEWLDVLQVGLDEMDLSWGEVYDGVEEEEDAEDEMPEGEDRTLQADTSDVTETTITHEALRDRGEELKGREAA
jgi:hypothetical protein